MKKLLVLCTIVLLSTSLFAMGNMKDTKSTANNCMDKAKSCCCQQTTTTNNCSCCCCPTNCSTTSTTDSAIKK